MTTAYARPLAASLALALLASCAAPPDVGITEPPANDASFAASNLSDWSMPIPLGPPINSAFNDFQPAMTRDGLTLFFASNRPEGPGDPVIDQNIWVSRRACTAPEDAACAWGEPVPLGAPINQPGLEAAPGLSRDEHWLYFTSNRPGTQERDLFAAYRSDVRDPLAWEYIVDLGPGINTAAPEIAPNFFEGGAGVPPQLYFNRGLPGIDSDLYVSSMTADGTWGAAVPVAELNSADSEQRPSVKFNGTEIYYWSNRLGLIRLWQSSRESATDPWSAPVMVPSPIADGEGQHPFIHSHGRTETLLFTRTIAGAGFDMYVSTRMRGEP